MKSCTDSNPKRYDVKFDGGSAGIQRILLCKNCFSKPIFQNFVIEVTELENEN